MKTIIITGPSGSGKTFLSNKLSNLYDKSIVIRTDSYYRDNILIRILSIFKSDIYDRPLSIKKKELKNSLNSIYNKDKIISLTHYNFKNKRSSKSSINLNYTDKNQLLIIEGVFSHRLDLNYHNSINIVCDEKKEICYKRRLIRDQKYRCRSTNEINKKFNNSWYLFYRNVKNFQKNNEIITLNPSDKISFEKLIYNLSKKITKKNH